MAPDQNLEEKKKSHYSLDTLFGGEGSLTHRLPTFTVPLLQGRFKIIEYSKFILHYFHE